jgi:hypothetical protein
MEEFSVAKKFRKYCKLVARGLDKFVRRATNEELLVECENVKNSEGGQYSLSVLCYISPLSLC